MDKTMTRFSRRTALVGTATALALVLGGCSGAAQDAGASSEPAGEPQRGGELRVSIGAEPIAPAFDMGTMAVTSVGHSIDRYPRVQRSGRLQGRSTGTRTRYVLEADLPHAVRLHPPRWCEVH